MKGLTQTTMGNTLSNSENSEKEHLVGEDSQETSDTCKDSSNNHETSKPVNVYYKALAFFTGLLHIGCVVSSSVCVQLLERSIPDFELNFIRSLTGFVLFSGYFALRRHSPLVPKSGIWSTVAYGTVVTLLSLSNYISVTFIPVASFQSLKTTANVSLSVIIFALFAQEHAFIRNIISAMICVTGVLMIVQPEFMFTGSQRGIEEQHGKFLNS